MRGISRINCKPAAPRIGRSVRRPSVAIPTRLRPSSDPSEQEVKPQGDPGKILRLAIPVSLESVFQMGFNVIDQVIVGLLGADAVAAVGLSNSIASIALLLYASTGVGAGVMVARACGRKDLKEVSQIASAGQGLSGLLGLITAFLLVWFSQPLLWMVGADPKLAGSANGYFHLYAAWLTIRFGRLARVALGALYAGSSSLLPAFYPKVGQDVLQLAFWGVLLMAVTQPAKVLSSVLGNGVLASGGDTHFVLMGNLTATYAVGLPAAGGVGLLAPVGVFGVFAANVVEEAVKAVCFLLRFLRARWYEHAIKEEQSAKDETQPRQDRGNESQGTCAV